MDTNYINSIRELLTQSIEWMQTYQSESQAISALKKRRRALSRIAFSLEGNCAVAAYGESQVGKSYLMNSLLAAQGDELRVNNGRGESLSFINDLNPSGGNTSKEESTGVITRFTIQQARAGLEHLVRIRTLSIVDLVLMLCDAYYKDVRINPDTVLQTSDIDLELTKLSEKYQSKTSVQSFISEDDIYDIHEYITEIVGNHAVNVIKSKLTSLLAPCIASIPVGEWKNVFALLWNKNETITSLFETLIGEYQRIKFSAEIYVPFDAVLRNKGTILKVSWLDIVVRPGESLDDYERYCAIHDSTGGELASDFDKAILSALTAELTFVLPPGTKEDKPFLERLDLLDFPGSRRRESIREQDLKSEQCSMLRRGKVAYLFNKYSRSLRINSILFCQHQDMTGQSEMGEALDQWIRSNIGSSPIERAKYIGDNNGISPFFIIATKFNTDLKWTNEHPGSPLSDRWRTRFDNTLSNEVIKPDTYSWFNMWTQTSEGSKPFRGIYLLRDFFWSNDQQIFRGYDAGSSKELEEIHPSKYHEYRRDLKHSFVEYPFVREHFENPEKSWLAAATVGNDGSQAIIDDLGRIATTLDEARRGKYARELKEIIEYASSVLSTYYIPTNDKEQIQRIQQIISRTKMDLDVLLGSNPDAFGLTIEALMISPLQIRQLAYDIIIRKTKRPVDLTPINSIRMMAQISESDTADIVRAKLCQYYHCSVKSLETMLSDNGINLQDLIKPTAKLPTTPADVLCQEIVAMWAKHIHKQVGKLDPRITHREHIGDVLVTLLDKIREHKDILLERIEHCMPYFPSADHIGLNSIADSVAVLLNNFVTKTGADYLTDKDYQDATQRAISMEIDTTPYTHDEPKEHQLINVLEAFDQSKELLKTASAGSISNVLYQLPWWNNAHRWRTSLIWGILFCSDVKICDRVANDALEQVLNQIPLLESQIQ